MALIALANGHTLRTSHLAGDLAAALIGEPTDGIEILTDEDEVSRLLRLPAELSIHPEDAFRDIGSVVLNPDSVVYVIAD